jgi:hypothetical protein
VAQSGFDSELASGLSPETDRRATVSGMAASRCNPAAPQTLLRCSSADCQEPTLVQQRLALARLPSDLDQKYWSRQNSRQGPEQPRSRSERTMRMRLDQRQADEAALLRLAAIPLCPCAVIMTLKMSNSRLSTYTPQRSASAPVRPSTPCCATPAGSNSPRPQSTAGGIGRK